MTSSIGDACYFDISYLGIQNYSGHHATAFFMYFLFFLLGGCSIRAILPQRWITTQETICVGTTKKTF